MRVAVFALPAPSCLVQLSPDAIQTFQSPLILLISQLGSSSTLTVTYTNANHVWITDQTGATVAGTDTTGLTETNISQTLNFNVSPLDNTTYRAHARRLWMPRSLC